MAPEGRKEVPPRSQNAGREAGKPGSREAGKPGSVAIIGIMTTDAPPLFSQKACAAAAPTGSPSHDLIIKQACEKSDGVTYPIPLTFLAPDN